MVLGWSILTLFLLGYFAFAGAVVWHIRTYSYGPMGKWVVRLFLTVAVVLALASLLFFALVNWGEIFSRYA